MCVCIGTPNKMHAICGKSCSQVNTDTHENCSFEETVIRGRFCRLSPENLPATVPECSRTVLVTRTLSLRNNKLGNTAQCEISNDSDHQINETSCTANELTN